jgi:hypothetical protein
LDAAVKTYERVVAAHPDDSASAERLAQLKNQSKGAPANAEKESVQTPFGKKDCFPFWKSGCPRWGK